MTLNEKAEKTILKLLKLTRNDEIVWSRSKDISQLPHGTNDSVEAFYTAKQGDMRFRAYEASFQVSYDGETYHWTTEPRVEIIDFDGAVIWRLPKSTAMWDLLETVQLKAGSVEQGLDQFLNDD
jgi:hypothetical protein